MTNVHGGLLVVKPPGMTSHDVVEYVRKQWGVKVGHSGTLDPAAAGLLVLCVGSATRLTQYLVGCDKVYRAEISFGITTTTADAEGELTTQQDAAQITAERVAEALAALTGPLEITVPAYSAVSQDGTRLYQLARRGEAFELPTRRVEVRRWELLEFREGQHPKALTEVECSKGTYVRSLAEMLGERLGTGAYLSFLVRTQVGPHRLEDGHSLEHLAETADHNERQALLISPLEMVAHLPRITVDSATAERLRHGTAQPMPDIGHARGPVAVVSTDDVLICIADAAAGDGRRQLQPRTVLDWRT